MLVFVLASMAALPSTERPAVIPTHDHDPHIEMTINQLFSVDCKDHARYGIDIVVDRLGIPHLRSLRKNDYDFSDSVIVKVNGWLKDIGAYDHLYVSCAVNGLGVEIVASEVNPPQLASSLTFFIADKEVIGKNLLYSRASRPD